jgi:hypothetical protein
MSVKTIEQRNPIRYARRMLRLVQFITLVCLGVLAIIAFYDELASALQIPFKHHLSGVDVVTLSAFMVGAFALLLIQAQAAIAVQAMQQQDAMRRESAEKSDAIILAIQSLTEELQKRPVPIENVNFSIFGAKARL